MASRANIRAGVIYVELTLQNRKQKKSTKYSKNTKAIISPSNVGETSWSRKEERSDKVA